MASSMVIPRFGRDNGYRERGRRGRAAMCDRGVSSSIARNISSNQSTSWKQSRKNDHRIYVEPYESPPLDLNGNVLSIPMNIILEKREEESYAKSGENDAMRERELLDYYESEFIAEARQFRIEIFVKEGVQFIKEGGRYVLSIQLVCSNWNEVLIRFMYSFFAAIRGNRIASHEMPIITSHSHLLYPLRVISAHEDVPIAQVKFASIVNNGQLGIHWNMIGGSENGDERFTFRTEINANFEYDKASMHIDYYNCEKDAINRDQENEIRGKITIDFSTIHRVIFDQECSGEPSDGNRRISLILIVDVPPTFQSQWEHRAELQRGAYPGEISDRETINFSKTVLLEFDIFSIRNNIKDPKSSLDLFFFDMLSRMSHKTRRAIEFTCMDQIEMIKGEVKNCWIDDSEKLKVEIKKVHPYNCIVLAEERYLSNHVEDAAAMFFDKTICGYIDEAAEKLVDLEIIGDGSTREYHIRWKSFRLQALLHGLLDRGMEYRIELLRSRYHSPSTWQKFVSRTAQLYAIDEKRTLYALERVLGVISEGRPNCSIPFLFEKEYSECTPSSRMAIFNEDEKKEGYWRIMKLVVTPTRVIFVGYETIMGNRVLNMYAKNENHIIRVAFRDDRYGPIRAFNYSGEVQDRIREILIKGITYAGRTFAWLGNSNSQLGDQGCYMMHVDFDDRSSEKPHDIRNRIGDFYRLPNIPKMIARLGQVFTQCKPSALEILPSEVGMEVDYIGGMNSAGKPYTFSDGVGLISSRHAAALTQEHALPGTASAYQIRFRGEKGMLCVDPLIDEKNELMDVMGRGEDKKKILIRPSMSKFVMTEGTTSSLEIVKLSSSAATFLNRPLINILCQVSERQGAECHRRVRGRVGELMNSMIMDVLRTLYVEEQAYQEIKEMPIPFSSSVYTLSNGLHFTTEPFFRSLLRANAKFALQKQMDKMNIRIPSSNGRLMYGVVDTTGLLQYGQVYCQYSGTMRKQGLKMRSYGDQKGIVLTGRTMITKNPCVSAGDVRMFDAVDIPALSHLIDVIVFPRHGPRPHPDEMAGSDLDGDEYIVIWDQQLLLERNEEASIFPIGEDLNKWAIPKTRNGNIDFERCEEKKAEFYTQAIVYGQGSLCISHLAISDLYGLFCKPAESLAMKIAQTLDYPKSGIRPAKIITKDATDPDDPTRVIPAEKSNLKAHFLRNYNDPGYESRGIVADVFNEARKYQHALNSGEGKETIALDPSFNVAEWEEYKPIVECEFANYTKAMKYVFQLYGIASEEEMISGMIISMKNRISDNEEVDGTLFTTNKVIEGKVRKIAENAREKFFKNLIDWKTDLEEIQGRKKVANSDSIMNKYVKSDTNNIGAIRKKASAAYHVAYNAAKGSMERGEQTPIILSFPWIVYDVLLNIKMMRSNENREIPEERSDLCKEPIAKILSESIDRYCESDMNKYGKFVEGFDGDDSIVGLSMKENDGLARASFVVLEWARNVGALNNRFREEQLLSLFILFGLGEVSNRGFKRKFIQKPSGDERGHPRKGDHILRFFEFVASREFRMRSTLSFADIGGGILLRGEWKTFSDVALSSFLSLITTLSLDLPMKGNGPSMNRMEEFESKVMRLPERVISNELETVQKALRDITRCKTVKLRPTTAQLVVVSAFGTSEQLKILSSFIYPPAPPRETSTKRGTIYSLAAFTYKRIVEEAKKAN